MKRIFSFTIALCLVLSCFLPVYAVTIDDYRSQFTTDSAIEYGQYHIKDDFLGDYQETRATDVSDSITHILLNDLIRIFTGSGGTMYNSVSEFMSWLTPVGAFGTNHSITGVTQYEIIDYIAWTLSGSGATVYDTIANIASLSAYLPILDNLKNSLTNPYSNTSNNTSAIKYNNNHSGLVGNDFSFYTPVIQDGGLATTKTNYWNSGSPIGNVALLIKSFADNIKDIYQFRWVADLKHYNDTLTTWEHSTNTQTSFTPESAIQGLYRYLAYIQSDTGQGFYSLFNNALRSFTYYRFGGTSASRDRTFTTYNVSSGFEGLFGIITGFSSDMSYLYRHLTRMTNNSTDPGNYLGYLYMYNPTTLTDTQQYRVVSIADLIARGFEYLSYPVARLSYVLANDEEIAARNAAKNNQTAVVNNFVASTGNGSISTSDIGSISNLSSGYKSNFGSSASVTGIFDVFNSNNMGWFSQETFNQLDTTSQSRSIYETPLLDQQIQDIYEAIGVEPDESR